MKDKRRFKRKSFAYTRIILGKATETGNRKRSFPFCYCFCNVVVRYVHEIRHTRDSELLGSMSNAYRWKNKLSKSYFSAN